MHPLATRPALQAGALPSLRLVGFGLVVLVAIGLAYVAIRYDDPSSPVYEDEDGDDEPERITDDPAFGVGGTRDVTEVLEVDDEAAEDRNGGRSRGGDRRRDRGRNRDRDPPR